MPIDLTYDLDYNTCSTMDRNRLQSLLERLGWRLGGGSVYHYPADGGHGEPEDWFNEVVPALMLFRSFVVHHEITVTRFTIRARSEVVVDAHVDLHPKTIRHGDLHPPTPQAFGEGRLLTWLAEIDDACPYPLP